MTRLSPNAREKFLNSLSRGLSVSDAAALVGATRQAFYLLRQRDPAFSQAWDAALDEGSDRLEDEARRRAVDGIDCPIFYRGEVVGYVPRYSDTLLMFLLRARRPEKYRERPQRGASTLPTDLLERMRDGLARVRALRAAGGYQGTNHG